MAELFSKERWGEVSPYLDRALELTQEQRTAWLASLREGDSTLARDVETMLREHDAVRGEGFLELSPELPASPAPSLAGQTVGAYRLRALIGQGGMGSVWQAERSDGRFQGVAAVKFLNASLAGQDGEARFRREGSILARLRHPHIAHLIDAGVSALGHPYLVLEHVDGEHIDRYCDARGLGVEARIRLFLDVLEAVAHAHANLIVHRDIKPSNVLVDGQGRVKLLDFGIAKLLDPEPDAEALTREGQAALTPEYAAPEQFTGQHVTTATDVYALGVLLYVLLTGRHPAGEASRTPAQLIRAVVDTEAPRASDAVVTAGGLGQQTQVESAARRAATPRRLRTQLRGDLDNIVARAIKKKPAERYPSVEAMADDLRRHLEHRPVSARADSLGYRAAKFLRRHARAVAAAAVVVVLLASLVTFYTRRLAAERDRARLQADKAARVSSLLTELLTGADPYARGKGEPTVRDVLDAGARRIRQELAGQPELQVEMLSVMGRVYQRLGAYDKARPLLEEALAIGRAARLEDERMAQTLNNLGVVLQEQGELAAAAPLLEQSLALRRRLLGGEHPEVAVTLVELGRVYTDRGELGRAEPLFREALAVRRKVLGDGDSETATSASDLGLLLRQKGDAAGAEQFLREALAITLKVWGTEHPDSGTALGNLALVVGEKGGYAEAETLFRQAAAISRKTLGPAHPDLAGKLNNLAQALREQGKLTEAEASLEEALRIARPTLGEAHPMMGVYRLNLGRVRLAQGRAAEAEPLMREAVGILERAFAGDDWRVARARSLLGACLTALRGYPEAEALLLAAGRTFRDRPGPQGRDARANEERLAALYQAWGRPASPSPTAR